MRTRLASLLVLMACGDGGDARPIDAAGCGDCDAPNDAPERPCESRAIWTSLPRLPLGPTQETAAVAVDGRIYVLGGFNGTLGVIDAVQIFDVSTCSWSMGPPLPRAVHHTNAAVVDGTIYVVGAMVTLNFTAIGDVWRWNPATDAGWTAGTAMPAGTQRGASVVGAIGTRIYVAGGLRNGAVADVSAYDTVAQTWDTTLPPLPAARDHGCGAAIGGRLYVAGGRSGNIGSTSAAVYEYTPDGAWLARAPMPTARGGTACGVVADQLIVGGGEGNPNAPDGVFPDVESYDAVMDRWTVLPGMPTARHGLAAAAWDGGLYFPGGATREGFGAVDDHEVLRP